MSDPVVLVAVLGAVVPLIVGVLTYLSTRGGTSVARQVQLDAAEEKHLLRITTERDRFEGQVISLTDQLAECRAMLALYQAEKHAKLASDLLSDAVTRDAEGP